MEALQLGSDSLAVTLDAGGATGEEWAIPVNNAGRIPRSCYIATDGKVAFLLGTDEAGGNAISAGGKDLSTISTVNAALLQAEQPLVIQTGGSSHIITISFDGTGSEKLVITPLEN